MPMEPYIVDDNDVIHETKVDFKKRTVQKTIHLVQYENRLPIIKVFLMEDGYSYTVPAGGEVWLRWGKPDHTYVYKRCLIGADRRHVYFDVDYQMTYYYGQLNPILELIIDGRSAGSSPIPITVDRNPIQAVDRESETEDEEIDIIRNQINLLNTRVSNNEKLAEQYIVGRTYLPDQIVIKDDIYYRCIAQTSGEFDETKWVGLSFDYINGALIALSAQMEEKVDKTTEVNGHALGNDVNLTPPDIGVELATDSDIDSLFF